MQLLVKQLFACVLSNYLFTTLIKVISTKKEVKRGNRDNTVDYSDTELQSKW